MADYRPKAQALYKHLYYDVSIRSKHIIYQTSENDPKNFDNKTIVDSVAYKADATRFIRHTFDLNGTTSATILRPDVNYLVLGEKDKPVRMTYKQEIPEHDRPNIPGKERWKFDCADFQALGLGFVYRDEPLLTILTKKGIVISEVQFFKDGLLDAASISLHFPPNPDRITVSFHTDIGICYRQVWRMEQVQILKTETLEYECKDRSIDKYIPKRRVSIGTDLANKQPPILGTEYVVEEFRKQSRFDDSVFRLEQFGLPDFIAAPPRTGWRSRILIALGGACGLITLAVLWRLGRLRTAAQS